MKQAGMSGFRQGVYRIVRQIPAGKVATYGQIAFLLGSPRAARIGGAAMQAAAEGLPCHRVLYGDGSLCRGEIFGGEGCQRQLLEQEGVCFCPDGRVDLKQCLWQPEQIESGFEKKG